MGVTEEVQQVFDAFVALVKAGEFEKACNTYYAEDATLGGNGSDLIVGRASLFNFIQFSKNIFRTPRRFHFFL